MNKIGHLLILFAAIFSIVAVSCSPKSTTAKVSESSYVERFQSFPADWSGSWLGNLGIYTKEGLQQQVRMGLDIHATEIDSIYNWQVTYYIDSVADVRTYTLHVVDIHTAHYRIDENNGIVLDAFLRGNKLISVFEVMDNILQCEYSLDKDRLHFETTMYKSKASGTTGSTVYNGESIPAVSTYAVSTYQQATLYKVDSPASPH